MLEYDVVDVFTDRPFAGNQLAVVHGSERLSTGQCQAIAQEFNFSETTFPGTVAGGTEYTTRIFTPGAEIPFAGHPTLGTAWVLRERGLLTGDEVTQHCGAGRIGVRFHDADRVELSATPRELVGPLDDELVTALLRDVGLSASDLAGPVYAAGCGLTFVHVPVAGEALARAVPSVRPLAHYREDLATAGATSEPVDGLNIVAVSGEAPSLTVRARVFVPGLSVPEDPATGSAAAGLGVALVAAGLLPDGGSYDITQGVEMGRPSSLQGRVEVSVVAGHGWSAGASDEPPRSEAAVCHVAGRVHPIARGQIAVPPR